MKDNWFLVNGVILEHHRDRSNFLLPKYEHQNEKWLSQNKVDKRIKFRHEGIYKVVKI